MPLKKHKFIIESESGTIGIGINASLKDYKLCFLINKELNISLSKNGVARIMRLEGLTNIPCFFYCDEHHGTGIYLLKNKQDDFIILPKYKIADYLLLIKNENEQDYLEEIRVTCQRISNIQSTFALPTELLNFIEID